MILRTLVILLDAAGVALTAQTLRLRVARAQLDKAQASLRIAERSLSRETKNRKGCERSLAAQNTGITRQAEDAAKHNRAADKAARSALARAAPTVSGPESAEAMNAWLAQVLSSSR